MDLIGSTPAAQRRQVIETLRAVRNELALVRDRWTVAGTVYEPVQAQREDGSTYVNCVTRKRQPEEYPENQAAEWCRLMGELTHSIQLLTELKEEAALRFLQITSPPQG